MGNLKKKKQSKKAIEIENVVNEKEKSETEKTSSKK